MSQITDQEKQDFISAIQLLTENKPLGPTIGDIFYFLNDAAQSTQIKGQNSPIYNRLLKVRYCLLMEKRITQMKLLEKGKSIMRYKIPNIELENSKDDMIDIFRLADIISKSVPVTHKWVREIKLKEYEIDGSRYFSEKEVYEYLESISIGPNKEINKMKVIEKIEPTMEEVYKAFMKAITIKPEGFNITHLHKYLPNTNYETVKTMVKVLVSKGLIRYVQKLGSSNIYALPEIDNPLPGYVTIQETTVKQARVIECEVCPDTILPSPARSELYTVKCNHCSVTYLISGETSYRLYPGRKIKIWGPK